MSEDDLNDVPLTAEEHRRFRASLGLGAERAEQPKKDAARAASPQQEHELIHDLRRARFFGCCTNGCETDTPTCERCLFIAKVIAELTPLAEVCICAAVLTREGAIFRGHRHDDAIMTAGKSGCHPSSLAATQGFITSRGRYVNREDAARLQEHAGIVSVRTKAFPRVLFSEDLY